MAVEPLKARYGSLHNTSMAVVSAFMITVAIVHFIDNPANAPTLSFDDSRFVLFFMLAMAMAYYIYVGVSRTLDRRPQVTVDRDGIELGFGRNRRFAWNDVRWVRLRRLGFRPHLEIGLAERAFVQSNLRLSPWSFDDSLRPVSGQPTSVLVRDNGLDTKAAAMLDAVRTFRPNLVKS